MEITEEEQEVFEVIVAAAQTGNLAIIKTRRKSTGKEVVVMCISKKSPLGVKMWSVGELVLENGVDLYETPEGATVNPNETKGNENKQ